LDGPGCYALTRNLLQGDELAAFNCGATTCGNKTVQNFRLVLQDLIMHMLPRCALQMQGRFMHHKLYKPFKVPVWDFMTQLMEINQILNNFSPFAADQALPKDEILDIAEFAMPATWQKTMVLQGFDPTSHMMNKLLSSAKDSNLPRDVI